jgi:hypothetical protein
MRNFEWAKTSAGRATIAAFVFSLFMFGWTLVHAVRMEAVPVQTAPDFASASALATPARGVAGDVEAAVQADLFAADRSAPAHRYRIPGEDDDEGGPAMPPVLPVVLGTASSDPVHAFATVQLGEGHPVILHVGDKIGAYTVQSIEREKVVFTNASKKKLDIPELKP